MARTESAGLSRPALHNRNDGQVRLKAVLYINAQREDRHLVSQMFTAEET